MRHWIFIVVLSGLSLLIGCKDDDGVASDDLEGLFDKVWSDFDRTYSYFGVKGVDWDSIYLTYRPQIVNGQTTETELAQALADMTLSLRDLHVALIVGPVRHQYNNRADFPANSPENAVNYLSSIDIDNRVVVLGTIDSLNATYLRVKSLAGDGDFGPLADVLAQLPQRSGFILDIRDNGGGNDGIARAFVQRLTHERRVLRLIRFRDGPGRNDFDEWREDALIPDDPIAYDGPIILLTNRGTVSSAEGFAAMVRTLPNTFHLGDTTRGATGNPREFTLSNGWRYLISTWQVALPTGQLIEGQGIAPDSTLMNTDESVSAGFDLMMEVALRRLQ